MDLRGRLLHLESDLLGHVDWGWGRHDALPLVRLSVLLVLLLLGLALLSGHEEKALVAVEASPSSAQLPTDGSEGDLDVLGLDLVENLEEGGHIVLHPQLVQEQASQMLGLVVVPGQTLLRPDGLPARGLPLADLAPLVGDALGTPVELGLDPRPLGPVLRHEHVQLLDLLPLPRSRLVRVDDPYRPTVHRALAAFGQVAGNLLPDAPDLLVGVLPQVASVDEVGGVDIPVGADGVDRRAQDLVLLRREGAAPLGPFLGHRCGIQTVKFCSRNALE